MRQLDDIATNYDPLVHAPRVRRKQFVPAGVQRGVRVVWALPLGSLALPDSVREPLRLSASWRTFPWNRLLVGFGGGRLARFGRQVAPIVGPAEKNAQLDRGAPRAGSSLALALGGHAFGTDGSDTSTITWRKLSPPGGEHGARPFPRDCASGLPQGMLTRAVENVELVAEAELAAGHVVDGREISVKSRRL